MIDWPENLVNDIARRRAVIVIGSGVSRHSVAANDQNSRPPTWKAFLEKALDDCPNKENLAAIQDAIAKEDLLHACEWLKNRFDENWVGYLRRTFSLPAFKPSEIHDTILKLDSRIIFSLNFDDIYERHANSIHHGSHIVKSFHDADVSEFLRGDGRFIIKVHGSLHTANELIFTQKEYSRARSKYTSFYQAFDATLLTNTFLFIGSGYNDPDVNLILENQNFTFPTHSPHYFLASSPFSADRKLSLRENRGIKVLEYDKVDDNHSGLVTELSALYDKVESARYDIAGATSW